MREEVVPLPTWVYYLFAGMLVLGAVMVQIAGPAPKAQKKKAQKVV